MSYIVLLFFLKSYYLRLCVWRISFWSYANCFNFVSLRAKETGLHNQALANEGELLERRDFMKLILEVLDLTGSSLCWSSCVLEVTMLLAPASAEVLVFLRSPCFLLAVSFHDFLGKKYELHHPRYCVQLLFSIAFWLGFFFFSWPRIWRRAPVVRIDSDFHQRSKTGRLACIPSMKTQLANQLCSCFCYLGWS